MNKIENIVCVEYNLTPSDLHAKTRKGNIKEARQIVMYFAKELNSLRAWSYIGGFYNLDHATAMHAHKTIKNLMTSDKTFCKKIKRLRMKIKSIKYDKMLIEIMQMIKPIEFDIMKLELRLSNLTNMLETIKKQINEVNESNVIEELPEPEILKSQPQKQLIHEVSEQNEGIASVYYADALKRTKQSYFHGYGEIKV
jgi:hypothetical protein